MRSFRNRHVGVFSEQRVGDDLASDEAFDGVSQKNLHAEKQPTQVHQVVGPAVIFQQITCKKINSRKRSRPEPEKIKLNMGFCLTCHMLFTGALNLMWAPNASDN